MENEQVKPFIPTIMKMENEQVKPVEELEPELDLENEDLLTGEEKTKISIPTVASPPKIVVSTVAAPTASPVPPRPALKVFNAPMKFGEIWKDLLAGRRLRRQEWPEGWYIFIHADERLTIYNPNDKQNHPLFVKTGDIQGEDWVVC